MNLERAVENGRSLRAVGFDDSPFDRSKRGGEVLICGVVCSGTRFEGMVTTRIRKDGWNATEKLIGALQGSKFLPQLHLILIDGVAFGGFNVVDLPAVHAALGIPVVAVTRGEPDLQAIEAAVQNLPRPDERMRLMRRAGEFHQTSQCSFQVVGTTAETAARALERLTDTGNVPEAIRLAHLIGSAVVTGESGRRA